MPEQRPDVQDIILPNLDAAYNLARWLTRDPTLAEDIVQDSVARALTYAHSFRGDNARAWLLQIVRNTAYAALRARTAASAEIAVPEDIEDHADTPEAALEKHQGLRQLDAALASLPDELRECLVLRELEDFSYKEIVQATGVPMGTVMSRLWRARQALLGFCAKVARS